MAGQSDNAHASLSAGKDPIARMSGDNVPNTPDTFSGNVDISQLRLS
jgi:hypothetical protein